jgi:membrane-bound lytic murein transglycosylase F
LNKTSRKYIILRAVLLGLAVVAIAFFITRNLYHREEAKKDALRRIRERGCLIALTDQNTLNYFIYRGEPMGYQFELLQSFARYLGVPLRIIASNDITRLNYYLNNKAADLMALNLPITSEGRRTVRFSAPFGETRLVLVQRKTPANAPEERRMVTSLKEFPADTVYVRKNPSLASLYHMFYKNTGKKAILKEVPDITQEELIRRVSAGTVRFAICQENVAMLYHRYYSNLDISLLAFPLFSYGWGVDRSSDSLRTEVDAWLAEQKKSGELKQTYLDYFDNQRIAGFIKSEYFSVCSNKLSPFDEVIRQQSRQIWWDWRLVASLIYEESNFRPGQTSSKSASGLMQLMPETAAKFGIDSLSGPAAQIAGGVKYLRYLDKQLPDEISSPVERIYFVLASYNVGIGRVMAAREKAEKYGKDKNRWNGHVDYYLLRRSKKDPVAKNDTSDAYPVDYKTEGFVDDIVSRYFHYRNLIK